PSGRRGLYGLRRRDDACPRPRRTEGDRGAATPTARRGGRRRSQRAGNTGCAGGRQLVARVSRRFSTADACGLVPTGPMPETRYDVIGDQYAATRREDPRIAALIHAALGEARTIVNVGAGAGSYEPRDRHVVAVEPSEVMIAQRDPRLPPAIRSRAYPLPLEDPSMDGATAT